MEQKFNGLTMEYSVSAREYFMVLRLAIYHITGKFLEKAHEITQFEKTDEIYEMAIRLLKTLNR